MCFPTCRPLRKSASQDLPLEPRVEQHGNGEDPAVLYDVDQPDLNAVHVLRHVDDADLHAADIAGAVREANLRAADLAGHVHRSRLHSRAKSGRVVDVSRNLYAVKVRAAA